MTGEHEVSMERALELATASAVSAGVQTVPVADTAGRVLADAVRATRDLPAADCSAMDGWAVRAADTPGELRDIAESAAGRATEVAVGPAQAIAISTGAVLPAGADAVARREYVEADDTTVRVTRAIELGKDVRRAGEVIRAGEVLMAAGHRVMPHEVGAIGAMGHATVSCRARPRVAILSTGAELVALGAAIHDADVYDSSRIGLAAQAVAAGADVVDSRWIGDDLHSTTDAITDLLAGPAQVIVTNGGIGGGRHDHVREAFRELEVETLFLRIRAGTIRPTFLGRHGDRLLLGLPGNPVSAATAFHLVARPLLGLEHRWFWAPILADIPSRPDRVEVVRCVETADGLVPTRHQGPHAVTSLVGATALAWVPEAGDGVEAGTPVRFTRIA